MMQLMTGGRMYTKNMTISDFDPELADAMAKEYERQEAHLEMIASENYASPRVMAAQGSYLTNKYAEGYPGKRYYGGCEFVDIAERLAIERVKKLFNAKFANVQPHSGSQANAAVYLALLSPGDTILGMGLSDGGHLTHGFPVNFSGKIYHGVSYGVNHETGLLDYDEVERLAKDHKPKCIVAGFSAYCRVVDWQRMRVIADSVGAYLVADMAHVAGLVAAGCYPSPLPHAHVVTSTTHKTLRGPRGGIILSSEDDEDLLKRLDSTVFPGTQGGPMMHTIAAKAVAFQEALSADFMDYQQQVVRNAQALAASLQDNGLKVVSGGTDNHIVMLDLSDLEVTGKLAESALGKAFITVNKNTVPGDKRSPFVTSGIRLGTPAVTTRRMREEQMTQIAQLIAKVIEAPESPEVLDSVRKQVQEMTSKFPVYEV